MNLKTHISNDLWLAIESTYQAGNYSHAILDAMHYMSNVIREKTGLDADGTALIGQALGGDSPRLRLNKLQTETEKNEQKGYESILRGMYQAIRNPRSHEIVIDAQDVADVNIYFVNYLLSIIEKSQEPFVLSKFIEQVFDPDFVKTEQYTELLVNQVPTNKRLDTLIKLYREKTKGDIYNVGFVVRKLISKLEPNNLNDYLKAVSDELSVIKEENDFKYNFHLLPMDLWVKLSDLPRLRAENRIVKEVKDGKYYPMPSYTKGVLATWARKHLCNFTWKYPICMAFIEKLEVGDTADKFYVLHYFIKVLPDVIQTEPYVARCITAMSKIVRTGDDKIKKEIVENVNELPELWWKQLSIELRDLTDESNPAIYLPDGSPFLKNEELIVPDWDDEIPF